MPVSLLRLITWMLAFQVAQPDADSVGAGNLPDGDA